MAGTETPTLEAIYKELQSMNHRLDFIEDLAEEVIIRELPKGKVSKRVLSQVRKSIAEMRRGKRMTLEELRSA